MQKHIITLAALITILLTGCAGPEKVVSVRTTSPPRAEKKPLPLRCLVTDFRVAEDIPLEFEPNAANYELAYEYEPGPDIKAAALEYLRKSNIFREFGERDSFRGTPEVHMAVDVENFSWRERTGLTLPIILTAVTFDLYYLCGGPVAWPEGKVRITATLRKPNGEKLAAYTAEELHQEWLSQYSLDKDTPSVQLMAAFTKALQNLVSQIKKDGRRLVETVKSDYAEYRIPVVRFYTPPPGFKSNKRTLNISIGVEDPLGIKSVRVTHNGKDVVSVSVGGKKEHSDELTIRLKYGRNEIIVTARSSKDESASEKRTVIFEPKIAGERRLLAIGAGSFKFYKDLKSDSANNDAKLVDVLFAESPQKLPADKIRIIRGNDCTWESALGAMQQFFRDLPGNGTAIIFFSGTVKTISGSPILPVYDTVPGQERQNSISLQDFDRAFTRRIRAGKIVIVLDLRGADETALTAFTRLAENNSRLAVLAGSFGESGDAGEFTRILSAGFSGEADTNDDGIVDLAELDKYATRKVPAGGIYKSSGIAGKSAPLIIGK